MICVNMSYVVCGLWFRVKILKNSIVWVLEYNGF